MPFSALVNGDVELVKDGTPPPLSEGGSPGTPAIPAYDSFETRYVTSQPPPLGYVYELDGAGNIVLAEQRYLDVWYHEAAYWDRVPIAGGLAPGASYQVTIHHDAVPGTPAISPPPLSEAQLKTLDGFGWNAFGQLAGFIFCGGYAEFYGDVESAGVVAGLAFGYGCNGKPSYIQHGFYLKRGKLSVVEKGVEVFDAGNYLDTDKLTIRLKSSVGPGFATSPVAIQWRVPPPPTPWQPEPFAGLGPPGPKPVIDFLKNDVVVYSIETTYPFYYFYALLYASGDRVLNGYVETTNYALSAGKLAPLGKTLGGLLAPLRTVAESLSIHAVSSAQLPALFGVGADKAGYVYSNGWLSLLQGGGESLSELRTLLARPGEIAPETPEPAEEPIYNVSHGALAPLLGYARGIVPRRASSASFLAPMRGYASDTLGAVYSQGQLAPLVQRPSLPFLRLTLSDTLGAHDEVLHASQIDAEAAARGGLGMQMTVAVGSRLVIASRMGVS